MKRVDCGQTITFFFVGIGTTDQPFPRIFKFFYLARDGVGSWVKYVPLEVPLGAAPCQKMYSFSDVFPWLPTASQTQ